MKISLEVTINFHQKPNFLIFRKTKPTQIMTTSFFKLLVLCFNISLVNAQTVNTGLIVPKNKDDMFSAKYCCVLSPATGFRVFDNPNGAIIGNLKKGKDTYSMYFSTTNKKTKFEDYQEVGYEISALKFIKRDNNFVKLSGKNNYWLSEDEIKKSNFITMDWMSFMIRSSPDVLGYYANEPGLKVRKTPDVNGEILGSVRGELFEIKLTNKTNGNWCYVKITKYKEHPCQTELDDSKNIESKMEGWIKVLDDNGKPNLWNYTKGC